MRAEERNLLKCDKLMKVVRDVDGVRRRLGVLEQSLLDSSVDVSGREVLLELLPLFTRLLRCDIERFDQNLLRQRANEQR